MSKKFYPMVEQCSFRRKIYFVTTNEHRSFIDGGGFYDH